MELGAVAERMHLDALSESPRQSIPRVPLPWGGARSLGAPWALPFLQGWESDKKGLAFGGAGRLGKMAGIAPRAFLSILNPHLAA